MSGSAPNFYDLDVLHYIDSGFGLDLLELVSSSGFGKRGRYFHADVCFSFSVSYRGDCFHHSGSLIVGSGVDFLQDFCHN